MNIIVLSDTHGLLRPEAKKPLETADAVIHAGDFGSEKSYNEIKAAINPDAPFFAVRGNNDGWSKDLPETLEFTLGGLGFFLIHNKRGIPKNISADIIIFGHSHKYFCEASGGILRLNPGSFGRKRFNLPITMAELKIDSGECSVKKIDITDTAEITKMPKDLSKAVSEVARRAERGESADKIAKKLGLDPVFATQVIRMKVTHPGIDTDGIIDRITKK